jgi:hypothetical protein
MPCEYFESCGVSHDKDHHCINDPNKCNLYRYKRDLDVWREQDAQMMATHTLLSKTLTEEVKS